MDRISDIKKSDKLWKETFQDVSSIKEIQDELNKQRLDLDQYLDSPNHLYFETERCLKRISYLKQILKQRQWEEVSQDLSSINDIQDELENQRIDLNRYLDSPIYLQVQTEKCLRRIAYLKTLLEQKYKE